jgi:hypothetical protein
MVQLWSGKLNFKIKLIHDILGRCPFHCLLYWSLFLVGFLWNRDVAQSVELANWRSGCKFRPFFCNSIFFRKQTLTARTSLGLWQWATGKNKSIYFIFLLLGQCTAQQKTTMTAQNSSQLSELEFRWSTPIDLRSFSTITELTWRSGPTNTVGWCLCNM